MIGDVVLFMIMGLVLAATINWGVYILVATYRFETSPTEMFAWAWLVFIMVAIGMFSIEFKFSLEYFLHGQSENKTFITAILGPVLDLVKYFGMIVMFGLGSKLLKQHFFHDFTNR